MHLQMLVASILIVAFNYKCLAYSVTDDIDEDYSVSLSPQKNFNDLIERSSQPESRLIPILTFNPFNKHQNQNSLSVNAATQQQLDQLKKDLQTLQDAYKKVKPVYPDVVKLYKNLKALNTKLKAQGITISKVVDNAKKIKETFPGCHKAGAKVLGTFCYWIVINPAIFDTARDQCRFDGGMLAEPSRDFSLKLYTALQKAFPTEIKTVDSNGVWIGADNVYDPPVIDLDAGNGEEEVDINREFFMYLSTNERAHNVDITLNIGVTQGALFGQNGVWSVIDKTESHAYLCQSLSLPKTSIA